MNARDLQKRFPPEVEALIEEGWEPNVALDKYHASKIPPNERCSRCSGTGNELYFHYRRCSACGGSGRSLLHVRRP